MAWCAGISRHCNRWNWKQVTAARSNLYAGDTQNTNSDSYTRSKYGDETNRLYRQNYALTWNGGWDNGVTTSNWVQYEHTRNSRIPEGLAGGTEGNLTKSDTGFRRYRS